MSQTSRSRFTAVRSALVAGAVTSGTVLTSGVGQAAAASDSGLSVANISVVVGSGAHQETVTVHPDSPAIGVQYSLVLFSSSADFLGKPVPSPSTHATCSRGAEGVFGNEGYAWTCTSSHAGWGAGTIAVPVSISAGGLQGTSPQCLNGGCAIGLVADWTVPLGGAEGTITIVPDSGTGTFPPPPPSPSASKTVQTTPSALRTSADPSPSSASTSSAPTPSAASATSASAAVSPSAAGTSSAVVSAVTASTTQGAPLDAAPTGGSDGQRSTRLWALLAVLCIIAAGVTSAVMAGRGRHRG